MPIRNIDLTSVVDPEWFIPDPDPKHWFNCYKKNVDELTWEALLYCSSKTA